jgi:hypothetical protein
MKKFHSLVLICVSLISIALCSTTFAGNRAGAASLTLGGGYDFFASKRHIKNAAIPFGAIGYDITDNWGVEGLLGFFSSNQRTPSEREISGTLVSINALYHFFPCDIFEPYLLGGIGVTGLNPNGDNAHNETNINGGVGAQLFIDRSVAFRVEARDLYTMQGGKNDVFLSAGVTLFLDVWC